jgi:hypothetical protein
MIVLAVSAGFVLSLPSILNLWFVPYACKKAYSITPFIRINWDGKISGYAENPDNWIFLLK